MGRFNLKTPGTKTTNLAGGKAYKHAPKMELALAVVSTFLENKHYENSDDRIARIKNLVSLVPDEYVAKLAVFVRTKMYLRSVSHLLVAELAKKHTGDTLVSQTIEAVAPRPDDLLEIVSILIDDKKKAAKLSKQVKRGVRHALLHYSPYQLAKYRGEGKNLKMVDLFNLCHPNPSFATEQQQQAWKALLNGELKNEETWEARLSSGEDKEKVWTDMISKKKLGYMALLRNLRNIENQANEKTKKIAAGQIVEMEAIRKSKQLPFRFYNAYENVSSRIMRDAVADAMDIALDNVPQFEGRTLVAIDCSGSMSGDCIKKASIFGAALVRSNDADLILFDDKVKMMRVLSKTPVIAMAERIQQEATGGGTNTSLVFDHAASTKEKYARIIILSDNESWQDSNYRYGGTNTNSSYNEYKKFNDCFIYAIDLAGYGTKDVTGSKVFHVAGWSEKIFDFMRWAEKENSLVDYIEQTEFRLGGKKNDVYGDGSDGEVVE